ncbi:hypothetical protein NEF87_002498 [Candidatus Lokiarchaeum ossiferum]|uniref:DNA polymerase II small subunit n=1 Tax=Candidatus Lokiarchaeum ossiferum TaxID=2951803 RepID=A0ABY6HRS4_9ARCH|nr:hypothetical protein NEF87_002498 [Candidatus Lokiarchaeum sp. B-35]
MTIAQTPQGFPLESILQKFLASRINISPEALCYIEDLKFNAQELEDLIRKISFSPIFNSHVTLEILLQEYGSKITPNIHPQDISGRSNHNSSNETNLNSQTSNSKNSLNLIKKKSVLVPDRGKKNKKSIPIDDLNDIPEPPDSPEFPSISQNPPGQKVLKPLPTIDLGDDKVVSEQLPPESNLETPSSSKGRMDETEILRIREEKKKSYQRVQIRQSTSTFRPLASEYNAEVEIISDPTGKMFTDGKLDEFVGLQADKFHKLTKILKKRPEGHSLLDINMINRLENSVEVKFVGMVVEKRQTSKRNYLIEFEDLTGTCMTLVRQEPKELYDLMNYLLPDHVVIVDGYLSVNKKTNSRIIMINKIIFPDSPNTHPINYPQEDLSICFVSDLHFGSKYWLEKEWNRFVDYLNCNMGSDKQVKQAGKIKYLCIAGDIVDGIGIYPNQDKHLFIKDIYKQYEATAEYLSQIPDYIQIIASPGDHDAVRKAVPNPAISKEMAPAMYEMGISMVGCPTMVSLHGIKVQMFHGTSLIDMNMSIPGMSHEDPCKTMNEFIRARDLTPTYGKKTEIAPLLEDWMIMSTLPDILHTGHLHKNGVGTYHGITTINSGCFQGQTDFQKSLGIEPDFGKPTIINVNGKFTPQVIDLAADM